MLLLKNKMTSTSKEGEKNPQFSRFINTFPHRISLTFFIFLFFLFSSILSSCSKKKEGNEPPPSSNNSNNKECKSRIDFFPQTVSGESPLVVSFYASFYPESSTGLTAVAIDFGADGFVDLVTYQGPTSFYFVSTYSSLGSFSDKFIFWWNEDGKICERSFSASITVSGFCPRPSYQIESFGSVGNSAVAVIRVINLPLEQVEFYAGYEKLEKVQCYPDNLLQGRCTITSPAPSWGDWLFCLYGKSYCGNQGETICSPIVINYPQTLAVSYGIGGVRRAFSNGISLFAETPPFVTLFASDGSIIKRINLPGGDIRYSDLSSDGFFTFNIVGSDSVLYFVSFSSGKIKEVIKDPNLYGAVAFDVFERSGKRYAAFLRSFSGGAPGDILVYDITGLQASTPICQKNLDSGGREIRFEKDNLFVIYSNKILVFPLSFSGEVCSISDPFEYNNFSAFNDITDLQAFGSEVTIVWTSFEQPMRGNVEILSFDTLGRVFRQIGIFDVFPGKDKDVFSLKVSPFNLSDVAVGYLLKDSGKYKVKLYNWVRGESRCGVEGLEVPSRPISALFLSEVTVAVFDLSNNLTILDFSACETKKTKAISGAVNGANVLSDIDCSKSKAKVYFPDGSALAELDILPIFLSPSSSPSLSKVYPFETLKLSFDFYKNLYGVFKEESVFVADITGYFSPISFFGSDVKSFSAGKDVILIGSSNAVFYSKKGIPNFYILKNKQAKKIKYINGLFFIFSGNDIDVLEENSLSFVLEGFPVDPLRFQDVSFSPDMKIYLLGSTQVVEYTYQDNSFYKNRERTFYLPAGRIIDSEFSSGHIFFISDLSIANFLGIINTENLKITLLANLGEGSRAMSIWAEPSCLPNTIFASVYGVFGTDIFRGFSIIIPK